MNGTNSNTDADDDCHLEFDSLGKDKVYEDAYEEGMRDGRKSGLLEGYSLGSQEGLKLGQELGRIASKAYNLLDQGIIDKQLPLIALKCLAFNMTNSEDTEKHQELLRIRALWKECCSRLGIKPGEGSDASSVAGKSDSFEF